LQLLIIFQDGADAFWFTCTLHVTFISDGACLSTLLWFPHVTTVV